MFRLLLLVTAGAVLLAQAPAPARACSPPSCSTDQFLPVSGELPANALGIAVFLGGMRYAGDAGVWEFDRTTREEISFECTDSSGVTTAVPFELELVEPGCMGAGCEFAPAAAALVPQHALIEGHTCTVAGNACGDQWAGWKPLAGSEYLKGRAEFRVAEAADIPSTLGTLEHEPARRQSLETAGGAGCKVVYDACVVRVSLALSEDAAPWADALVYTTLLDGEPWFVTQSLGLPRQEGGSYLGRGRDLLYSRAGDPNLPRGEHRVSMRATLPGTDLALETPAETVSIDCGEASDVSSSSGCAVCPPRPSVPVSAWLISSCALALAVRRRRTRA